MPSKMTLIDLRNQIAEVHAGIMRQHGCKEVTTEEILREIKNLKAKGISAAADDLIDRSLVKIINEVSSRKRFRLDNGSGVNLFGEHPGVPACVSVGRNKWRFSPDLTVKEAKLLVSSKKERASKAAEAGFEKFVAFCAGMSSSEDETLGAIVQREFEGRRSFL